MSGHPAAHEKILSAILAGDLDLDDERARTLIEECATCRESLEIPELADRLDAARAIRQEVLAEADAIDDAPGLADVERVLLAQGRGSRRSSHGITFGMAAAALLLLVLWLARGYIFDGGVAPPHRGEILIGDHEIRAVAPLGKVEDFVEFRWEFDLPRTGVFEVIVYDGTSGKKGEEIGRSGELDEPFWRPPVAESSGWKNAILWEVQAFDNSRFPLGRSGTQESWRGRP